MKNQIQTADSQQGWAKLQRSLLDSPIIKNSKLFHIYGWCLLRANHKENWVSISTANGNKEIMVKKDQFIMGRKKAAETLGMAESTFYANIKKLRDYGLITIESNNQYSIVTIVNEDDTKSLKHDDEQQKNKEKLPNITTNQQPTNTNNNYKNNKIKNKKVINKNSSAVLSDNESKKPNVKNKKIDPFIRWAFKKLYETINSRFPGVRNLKLQLTIEEFNTIAKQYEWKDILHKLGDLEGWEGLNEKKSVYQHLITFLNRDRNIEPISNIEESSINYEWKRYKELKKMDRKRVRKERELQKREEYFQQIKDADLWEEDYSNYDEDDRREIVVQYFTLMDTITANEKLKSLFGKIELTLEEFLVYRLLQFPIESICGFVGEFDSWDEIDLSISFYENFGEYLIYMNELRNK